MVYNVTMAQFHRNIILKNISNLTQTAKNRHASDWETIYENNHHCDEVHHVTICKSWNLKRKKWKKYIPATISQEKKTSKNIQTNNIKARKGRCSDEWNINSLLQLEILLILDSPEVSQQDGRPFPQKLLSFEFSLRFLPS